MQVSSEATEHDLRLLRRDRESMGMALRCLNHGGSLSLEENQGVRRSFQIHLSRLRSLSRCLNQSRILSLQLDLQLRLCHQERGDAARGVQIAQGQRADLCDLFSCSTACCCCSCC